MKPIILGMGPAPIAHLQAHAWHPLAPSTRNLAMIVFGEWTALPSLEAHFELLNLNERYHYVEDANGRRRDAVHPDMATRTVGNLLAENRLPTGRYVICLGEDVYNFFTMAVGDKAGPIIIRAYHPSNLTAAKRKLPAGWQAAMRNQIRATVNLPHFPFSVLSKRPDLAWTDYGEARWRAYAARYSFDFTDQEWREIWGVKGRLDVNVRLDLAEGLVGIVADPTAPDDFDLHIEDMNALQDRHSDSNEDGWFYPDHE